ncbi:MAG: MBL fold metallo-hydrolase [Acidobacteria bacterium]|nr:MAG: MBL fold metallo-hydrolase [Acidobacteriota bacterium]
MARKFCVAAVFLALIIAGDSLRAQDVRGVVQAAVKAMGAANLKTIQYSGTGWNAAVGQSFSPQDDWPHFEVTRYTRTIDYDARSSREEMIRRQGNNPPRGGGGTPLQGEQQQVAIVSGNYAWNLNDQTPVPQPGQYLAGIPVAEYRQLDILVTPHGFLKAAMAAQNATAISITLPTPPGAITANGKATLVSFTAMGKYRINGTFNDQNLLELVQTWIPNPVYGDMLYELRYTNYKDYGGVKFPTVLHIHQGDPRLSVAHNSMEITINNVQPNVNVAAMTVPDAVQKATAPRERAESQKLADGVWLVAGGSHNSLAIDFRDFAAVIEAPLNEERSLAVISEVNKLIPNKPIKYVVNTHHHFDHSGGLRTYLAQGTTIVTHQANKEYYENVLFNIAPRTLQPDRFSTYYPYFSGGRRPLPIETVNQKYVISDGVRTVDLYPVQGLNHAATMLLVYLPKEKILVNADLYSPPAQGAPAPAVNANMRTLRQNIQRLKLDVAQHVPIHGVPGPNDQFMRIVGASSN